MSDQQKPLNPVHYKPTWILIRAVDDIDDLMERCRAHALVLSDVDVVSVRQALELLVRAYAIKETKSENVLNLVATVEAVLEKLKTLIHLELSAHGFIDNSF